MAVQKQNLKQAPDAACAHPGLSLSVTSSAGLRNRGAEPSVSGGDWRAEAAEAVVQADQSDIDILANALALEEDPARGQVDRARVHEQMVVFDADRPVRVEAVLEADADRAAQRVSLADASNAPVTPLNASNLSPVTAAPPFT